MTESEFQKGDDVIGVANKEEYSSNSILEEGWKDADSYSWFTSHQPPSTKPGSLSESEKAAEGWRHPGDSWKLFLAFSWQMKLSLRVNKSCRQ